MPEAALLPVSLLVAARVGPLLLALPWPRLPWLRLLLLVLALCFLVPAHMAQRGGDGPLLPALIGELVLGCALALCAALPFIAARSAGLLLEAAQNDAQPSGPSSIGTLYTWIVWLLFLGLLGPQVLLSLLVYSYQLIPMGALLQPIQQKPVLALCANLFAAALLIAAYPLAMLLIAQGALSFFLRFLRVPVSITPRGVAAPLQAVLVGVVVLFSSLALFAPLSAQIIDIPHVFRQIGRLLLPKMM